MKSSPITQRAATKYGSALPTQEVTVDAAGTTPAKFERMSPVKQVIKNTSFLPDDEDNGDINLGGYVPTESNTDSAGGVMQADPDEPREKVESVTGGVDLVQGARDLGKSKNQSVSIDTKTDKPSKVEESITSGETDASDSGGFVGPYERRQRMRAVRISERQAKRGAIKEARISERLKGVKEGTVKHARLTAKLEKAKQIKAEAERMRGSNADAYDTNFSGSGPQAPEFKTVKKNNVTFSSEQVANSSAGAQARLAANMKPVNMNTTPSPSRPTQRVADTGLSNSTPDAFRQARGTNPLEEKQPGVSKKTAKSPIYKMGGFGSKSYKK